MSGIVVAIDGPAGAGKSTTARKVADVLGYLYLDTGAMYRAVGHRALADGVDPDDASRTGKIARTLEITFEPGDPRQRVRVDGEDMTDEIRSAAVSDAASWVSSHESVRVTLVKRQQALGVEGGVVVEGRDTTTVVFPTAELKIFLEASVEARAERRVADLAERGENLSVDEVRRQIRERDERDRATQLRVGPWPSPEATRLDTTGLTIDQQVERVVALARERGA